MNDDSQVNRKSSNIIYYMDHVNSCYFEKHPNNEINFQNKNEQDVNEKILNSNDSIFSFRYLNKIRNNDNFTKHNNKFFISDFKHMVKNLKDSQPDLYFKHKLEEIKSNLEGLKTQYKISERVSKMESHRNILHKNDFLKSNSISIVSLLIIFISILFYFFPKFDYRSILINIFYSIIIKSYIWIFCLFATGIFIFTFTNKNTEKSNLKIKFVAEKCVREIENILTNNEEGSLVEVEQFSIIYCREYKIAKEEFEKSILLEIKELIYLGKTNLCEVRINNNSYFKFQNNSS